MKKDNKNIIISAATLAILILILPGSQNILAQIPPPTPPVPSSIPLPTTPPPGVPPVKPANVNKIPDNLLQQCLAIRNGNLPPPAVFSANSKTIPTSILNGDPLCTLLPGFPASQAMSAPPVGIMNEINSMMGKNTTIANLATRTKTIDGP
jgi:hypothetical protein